MIRRLHPPRIPLSLHEAGWRLWHGPYGWQCGHLRGNKTHVYPAPGAAIEAAWNATMPDHERMRKRARDRAWLLRGLGLL